MCERLAEIKKSYRNNVGLEGRTIFWLISEVERLERIDRVTAEALASARAEVERLKALLDKGHASSDKRDDEICKEAHAEGMERAAVIAEDYPGDNMMIAAAIRAEVKHD